MTLYRLSPKENGDDKLFCVYGTRARICAGLVVLRRIPLSVSNVAAVYFARFSLQSNETKNVGEGKTDILQGACYVGT